MLKTDLLRGIVPATGRAYIGCSSIDDAAGLSALFDLLQEVVQGRGHSCQLECAWSQA